MDEVMGESAGVVMVIVAQLIHEFVIVMIGCVVSEVTLHSVAKVFRWGKELPRLPHMAVFLTYLVLGLIAGAISLFAFKNVFITDRVVQVMHLLFAPLVMGTLAKAWGLMISKKEQSLVRLDSFEFGFVFAFMFVLARLAFGAE